MRWKVLKHAKECSTERLFLDEKDSSLVNYLIIAFSLMICKKFQSVWRKEVILSHTHAHCTITEMGCPLLLCYILILLNC